MGVGDITNTGWQSNIYKLLQGQVIGAYTPQSLLSKS